MQHASPTDNPMILIMEKTLLFLNFLQAILKYVVIMVFTLNGQYNFIGEVAKKSN